MHFGGSNSRFTDEETEGNEGAPGGSVHLLCISGAVCPSLSPDLTILRLPLQICHPPFSIFCALAADSWVLHHSGSLPCGYGGFHPWGTLAGDRREEEEGWECSPDAFPSRPRFGSGSFLSRGSRLLWWPSSAGLAGSDRGFPLGLVLGVSLYPDGFP